MRTSSCQGTIFRTCLHRFIRGDWTENLPIMPIKMLTGDTNLIAVLLHILTGAIKALGASLVTLLKNQPANARGAGSVPGLGRSPGGGNLQNPLERKATPVFLPGKSQGQRSLMGYSPWGHKESDTNYHLSMHASIRASPYVKEVGVSSVVEKPIGRCLGKTALKLVFVQSQISAYYRVIRLEL